MQATQFQEQEIKACSIAVLEDELSATRHPPPPLPDRIKYFQHSGVYLC